MSSTRLKPVLALESRSCRLLTQCSFCFVPCNALLLFGWEELTSKCFLACDVLFLWRYWEHQKQSLFKKKMKEQNITWSLIESCHVVFSLTRINKNRLWLIWAKWKKHHEVERPRLGITLGCQFWIWHVLLIASVQLPTSLWASLSSLQIQNNTFFSFIY